MRDKTARLPTELTNPKEVIDYIRRYEFGIGASLEGDGLLVVGNMRRRYQNLLSTIAEDLNSKESHFVLELVQNADDNNYSPGVEPFLAFTLTSEGLIVVNNETGFLPKHVFALCSAGESSKANKTGYIGEKGIGFKSVFKITDAPEVHSNGYHFQFNRSDPEDLLGYVVPHWKDPGEGTVDHTVTTLILPSRAQKPFPDELLQHLDANLLLFLKRLKCLDFKSTKASARYVREDCGPITTLTTSSITQDVAKSPSQRHFFRTNTKCDMSFIDEPKREGIIEAELVLAFPITSTEEASPDPLSSTYAFLPIGEFGFPFSIQADFVLISSREGVHEDLLWNITLRNNISKAFVESVEAFKSHPQLSKTYLHFLPDEKAILNPFFAISLKQIINLMGETDCIPVESGKWCKPKEIIIVSPEIRSLFDPQDALKIFGAEYPNAEFDASQHQLERVGCRALKTSDVANVFVKNAEWFCQKPIEWKARFFAYLASPTRRAQYIKELKSVPCLPIGDNRFVIPKAGSVFYPLSRGKKYGFESELTILEEGIYTAALTASPEVAALFDDLGVKQDNPYELITGHILKKHASHEIDSDRKALIGHVRYIRDKLEVYLALAAKAGQSESSALNVLELGLWVGTKKTTGSWMFQRPASLYLGKDYRPEFDIETLVGQHLDPVLFVSDAYLGERRSSVKAESDLENWHRFFYSIGINKSPLLSGSGNSTACSPELKILLESDDNGVRRATLECLDRNWHKYNDALTYTYLHKRNWYSQDTTFKNQLRATKTPTKRHATVPLHQAYQDNEAVRSILGSSAVFVNANVGNEKFLNAAGITYKVDAAACLKRLRQVRDSKASVTRDQVRAIYRQLEMLWPSERAVIESAFALEPLILIGHGDRQAWIRPADACWQPTNVKFLDSQHPPLQGPYGEYRTFFTRQLSVPNELPASKWVDALKLLTEIEDHQERQHIALVIYRRLSRELGTQSSPNWLGRFENERLFLDHRGDLVLKSDYLYANDDRSHAALFKNEPTIFFLGMQPDQLSSINNLLVKTNIKRISNEVGVEAVSSITGEMNHPLTRRVRDFFSCIARVVYSQSQERFEIAVRDKLFEHLRQLEVWVVQKLQLEVSLGNVTMTTFGDAAPKHHQLLLRADAPSHIDHVAIEIQRILRLPSSQVATISVLLRSINLKEAEDYLQVSRVSLLPPEEQELLERIGTDLTEPSKEHLLPLDKVDPSVIEEIPSPPEHDSTIEPSAKSTSIDATWIPNQVPQWPANSTLLTNFSRNLESSDPISSSPTSSEYGIPISSPHAESKPSIMSISTDVRSHPVSPWASVFPIREPSSSSTRRRHREKPRRTFESTSFSRLLSYVEPEDITDNSHTENEGDPEIAKHRKMIELAAISYFMTTAIGQWKEVHVMENPNNPGFDALAVAHDGGQEFIEVKGQSGAWTEIGVALTPTELLKAQQERERYWLCVVEYATDENRRQLYLVNNPFGIAKQFRFDKGWKGKAINIASKPTRPEPGLFITVAGQGKARIVNTKGKGKLVKLDSEFANGSKRFNKLYEPTTMALSVD